MATLYITEYKFIGESARGHLMQMPTGGTVAAQTVTPDANGELSAAFNDDTEYVRLCADVAIKVGFGSAPVIGDAGAYLPANTIEYFAVASGNKLIAATV